jgi:MerR family mercuric resistance operon transcriptional regulator
MVSTVTTKLLLGMRFGAHCALPVVRMGRGSLNSVFGYGVKGDRMDDLGVTIARAAEAASVGVETVRYYERRGLIPQPTQRLGSYRRYGRNHVARIRFIKRAQELGFSLEEIQTLLTLQDGTNRTKIQQIATVRLTEIRSRLGDLRRMERLLARLLEHCRDGKGAKCPIIEAIAGKEIPGSVELAHDKRRGGRRRGPRSTGD